MLSLSSVKTGNGALEPTPSARASVVVLCPDSQVYGRVVRESVGGAESERRIVPVIALDASELRGFPDGIDPVRHEDSARDLRAIAQSSLVEWPELEPALRFCISASDPTCRAAATLLSSFGGRRLTALDDDADFEAELEKIFQIEATGSVTLVVPGWTSETGRCTSEWLRRSLAFLRTNKSSIGHRPVGILTAPTPAALTQLVAKSLLQRGVSKRYRAFPGFLLTTESYATGSGPLPHYDANDERPLSMFDRAAIDSKEVLRLTELTASVLVVASHGRSYCGADGLFCGARPLASPPDAEVRECVMGMACSDPRFPRIDPRRYDASVIVLDACGSANWASPVWETGVPNVAYYALTGSASAVLVSDGLTLVRGENSLDIFWALSTSATLGEAAARLNAVRRYAAVEYPYFLLGDPEIASGSGRFGDWVTDHVLEPTGNGKPTYRSTLDGGEARAPFRRIRVPVPADEVGVANRTVYITHDGGPDALSIKNQYQHPRETEVWFDQATDTPLRLVVDSSRSIRVPPSIVDNARGARRLVSSWSPVFDDSKAGLIAASDAVVALAEELQRLENKAVLIDGSTVEPVVTQTLKDWVAAQRKCCEDALRRAPGGLWQSALWVSDNYHAHAVSVACVVCGLTPTTERTYDSSPAPARIFSECPRCDIIADKPLLAGFPTITLDAPASVETGKKAVVTLSIRGEANDTWCGAGMVTLAGQSHGVVVQPDIFPIWCVGASTVEQKVELSLPEPPPIPHLYRLRVLILLNNHWHWASRFLMVNRGEVPGK